MKKRVAVRARLLALLALIMLVACVPTVPVDPVDPTPVVPDPATVIDVLDGTWKGVLSFSDMDDVGNEEYQLILATLDANIDTQGNISGRLEFFTNDHPCDIEGRQTENSVELNVACNDSFDDYLAFFLSGEIDDGSWSGNYNVLAQVVVIRPGEFTFSYMGAN